MTFLNSVFLASLKQPSVSLLCIFLHHYMVKKQQLCFNTQQHLGEFIGSAHREETMHWGRIWAYNFGSNLTQCVSDIQSTMWAYDGWACSINRDHLDEKF